MPQRHLDDLERALDQNKWRVLSRYDGCTHQDPAFWIIGRPDGSNQMRLTFSINPELADQTIMNSLGCDLDGVSNAELYFAAGPSWPKLLKAFIEMLNNKKK